MRYGLADEDIEKIQEVLTNYPLVEKTVVYGSRAKGNYRHNSDIDLSLQGEGLTLSHLSSIENDLDDLLLPYTIDLSIFHKIENPDLVAHINRVGLVFYQKMVGAPRT